MLAGGVLVILELLRPGRGWAGIPGAVFVTVALYSLGQRPFTWYGLAFLILSLCLVLSSLRGTSYTGPLLSGAMFLAGSTMLLDGTEKINVAAASIGGIFMFCSHWLLRVAYRARLAKRS